MPSSRNGRSATAADRRRPSGSAGYDYLDNASPQPRCKRDVTVPGPNGPLEGTFVDAGKGAPVVVIIPGSGPTDRDGNNTLGVTAAPYRLLADALAAKGVSSVRADKRGMFGSKAAISDAEQGDDRRLCGRRAGLGQSRASSRRSALRLAGRPQRGRTDRAHRRPGQNGICGVVALASPGRKMGDDHSPAAPGQPGQRAATRPGDGRAGSLGSRAGCRRQPLWRHRCAHCSTRPSSRS